MTQGSLKKSRSTCCRPIVRSSSSTRACVEAGATTTEPSGTVCGRPLPCNASAPPDRKRLRQV
jgi:hypothetical protein